MQILREYFQRKAAAEAQGLFVADGLYLDVVDTLAGYDGAIKAVVDFAQWNKEKKLLGQNHIFSTNINTAETYLKKAGLQLSDLGARYIESKKWVYDTLYKVHEDENRHGFYTAANSDAFVPKLHGQLGFVVDDSKPLRTGFNSASLVMTWLDPYDPANKEFLEKRKYLEFTL